LHRTVGVRSQKLMHALSRATELSRRKERRQAGRRDAKVHVPSVAA
jgi:hypothetical protein